MIRPISTNDKNSVAAYLSEKLNLSFQEAIQKTNTIIKNGGISFLKEEKELSGICWVESRIINEKKIKHVEILVNNWKLAEEFIQCLRWKLNGEYWFILPKHDFLNRTYNKLGIRFIRVDGDKNIYCYKFERRDFISYKSEDTED